MTRLLLTLLAACCLAAAPASAPSVPPAKPFSLPPVRRVVLDNGMVVLLAEKHGVPMVDFAYVNRAGGLRDPAGKNGLASIVCQMVRKGTAARSAEELAGEMDFLGAAFSTGADDDATQASAQFLSKDAARGLELFADALRNPTFPQDELTKLIKQRVDVLSTLKDEPQSVVGRYYAERLFGSHPYGRQTDGYEDSIARITRADVADFHAKHYAAGDSILAVAGDFDPAVMEKLVRDRFGDWKRGDPTPPKGPAPEPTRGRRAVFVDAPDSDQAYFRFGAVSSAHPDPDEPYVAVVNTLLGGRFTSMLMTELRAKRGLTYNASSSFSRMALGGDFTISFYVTNDNATVGIDLAVEVLNKLHSDGVTQEQLESAKAFVLGQTPPRYETTTSLAAAVAKYELFGLTPGYLADYLGKVQAMTLADAKRVIAKHFPKDDLMFAVVGRAAEAGKALDKHVPADKIERKKLRDPGF